MEGLLRQFTSGRSKNSIEQFAEDVYCKGHLTSEIHSAVKSILKEVSKSLSTMSPLPSTSPTQADITRFSQCPHILCETTSPAVTDLCYLLEAALLHGLKEKLSISKVTNAILGPRSPVNMGKINSSPVRGMSPSSTNSSSESFTQDFWSIIQILCHNQVSESITRLSNVYTDIGRCRAWLRITLNEGLFGSYMEALTTDTSLLHGFYRSSAYVRDKDHMELLKSIMKSIDSLTFQLNYDSSTLNTWTPITLKMIGIQVRSDPAPVMPAVDALDEVRRLENSLSPSTSKRPTKMKRNIHQLNPPNNLDTQSIISEASSEALSSMTNLTIDEDQSSRSRRTSSPSEVAVGPSNRPLTPNIEVTEVEDRQEEPRTTPASLPISMSQKSSGKKGGWSSSPPSSETRPPERYSNLFNHYIESTEVVLSSTPDLGDIPFASTPPIRSVPGRSGIPASRLLERPNQPRFSIFRAKKKSVRESKDREVATFAAGGNFEVIPKSVVLNNEEPETQEFLLQLTRIGQEVGLDEQDYKCTSCGRPIGMIYGKYRNCRFDGYNYCLDCHSNEEAIIPSRIVYNFDFHKFPVAKKNKKLLDLTESDPLLDIKIVSPSLYTNIHSMAVTLDLRTQLFFLHAYIFTCQESVAQQLRKLVWPREHLFEHVHLYSVSDLVQVNSGQLQAQMRKAITFARNHVVSCVLCSQKGFICELCKSPNIIYPFDTTTTTRCEVCKSVFHKTCQRGDRTKSNCPRCLRIARRKAATEAEANDEND